MTHKSKNLVVLRYTKNTNQVEVVSLKERGHMIYGFQCNLREGKWSFLFSLSDKPEKVSTLIGRAIISSPKHRGECCPIGVYDVTDMEHVNAMLQDGIKAIEKRPSLD